MSTTVLRRTAAALIATVSLAGAVSVAPTPAGAAPPTADGPTAAGYGARWLAAGVDADGSVHGAGGVPSARGTLATALALATAGVDQPTFARTVAWLSTHVDGVTGTGTDVDPGAVGSLLMVVKVAGGDPHSFGGVDLVSRLAGALGTFEPGLYGAADPTYDGAYRQGLALVGLLAAGVTPPASALDWLAGQQCGTTDLAVQGGWQAYRAPSAPCVDPDPVNFVGVDTNSTAMALEAMVAAGRVPATDALGWLDRAQNSTGGWGYLPGQADDPNSTALVIQAIVATSGVVTASPWVEPGGNPLSALLSFQLGCDQPAADQGSFTFPGSDGAPNLLATRQAVWGAAQRAFPLGPVTFTAAPVPCQPAAATTSSTSPGSTTTAGPAAAAPAVGATPAFTG